MDMQRGEKENPLNPNRHPRLYFCDTQTEFNSQSLDGVKLSNPNVENPLNRF